MKVAIIGHGWVGKAMHTLFPDAYIKTTKIGTWKKVNACDVAFICVPTPSMGVNKKLDTSAVADAVWKCTCPLIVIRSTVNVGDCEYWCDLYKEKHIVMQPEYLGETPNHPMTDQKARQFLIIGGYPEDRKKLISVYTTVYNADTSIRQVTHKEAEFIKLTENRAILFKTLQARELYEACEMAGLDYYTIRDAVYGDDPRFNMLWTFIMPNKPAGCVSKCIPKDVYAWLSYVESLGYNPVLTRSLLDKNREWSGV